MLVGRWRIEKDGVTSQGHGAAAEVRYHARSLYSVLSLSGAKQVRVYLFQDGNPMPKESAGADVKFDSKGAYVEVTEGRMYYLVRTPNFTAAPDFTATGGLRFDPALLHLWQQLPARRPTINWCAGFAPANNRHRSGFILHQSCHTCFQMPKNVTMYKP